MDAMGWNPISTADFILKDKSYNPGIIRANPQDAVWKKNLAVGRVAAGGLWNQLAGN